VDNNNAVDGNDNQAPSVARFSLQKSPSNFFLSIFHLATVNPYSIKAPMKRNKTNNSFVHKDF